MFVAYNPTTLELLKKKDRTVVSSEKIGQVNRALTLAKKRGVKTEDFVISTYAIYNLLVSEPVQVKNLMTGELTTISRRDRGTCCDPSMERYWTM